MGCLSLNISARPTGRMSIDEGSEHLVMGLSCETGNMSINDSCEHLEIGVSVKPTGKMNMGFICTTDVGLPILYASDGALITIDGKYLIVHK